MAQAHLGHMCAVNSLVLRDLGIDAGRRRTSTAAGSPPTRPGAPPACIEERAQELVGGLTRPYPLATLTDAVAAAGEQYLREGLTSVTEAGVGGGWVGQSPVELAAYVAAREQGRLPVRTELMVVSDAFHPLAAHPSDGIESGHRPGAAHRLRRRLAPARPDEGLHRRVAGRPDRGHVGPLRRRARQPRLPAGRRGPAHRGDHRRAPGRLAGRRARDRRPRDRPRPRRVRRRGGPLPAPRPAPPDRALRRRPPRPGGPGRRPRRDPGRPGPVRHRDRRRDARRRRPGPALLALPAAVRPRRRPGAARQLRPARS